MLAGQDAHRLFVRLPGLSPDPHQLAVDLTLRHPRAVAVVNVQLEELVEKQEAIFVNVCPLWMSLMRDVRGFGVTRPKQSTAQCCV